MSSASTRLKSRNCRTFVDKDALRPDASTSHFVVTFIISSPAFTWISQCPSFCCKSIKRPLSREILASVCDARTMTALIVSSNTALSRCSPYPNGFKIACRSSAIAVAHADALPVHGLWTPDATCSVRDFDNDTLRWWRMRMASGGSDSPIYATTEQSTSSKNEGNYFENTGIRVINDQARYFMAMFEQR